MALNAFQDGHLQQDIHIPLVRVDPEGRCAAMLIYGTRLVVLPFRREAVSEEDGLVTSGLVCFSFHSDLVLLKTCDSALFTCGGLCLVDFL